MLINALVKKLYFELTLKCDNADCPTRLSWRGTNKEEMGAALVEMSNQASELLCSVWANSPVWLPRPVVRYM